MDVTYYLGDIPHLGTVLNISPRGAFLQTDQPMPKVGARLSFRFPVTEEPDIFYVKIGGTVRRRWDPAFEGLPGFGVRFDQIDELGKAGILRRYLQRFQKDGRRGKRRGYHYSKLKLV